MAVDLALGVGVALARGVRLALGAAPALAPGLFGRRRSLQFGFGDFLIQATGLRVGPGVLQLGLDVDQARALGQPSRRAGRRMRCGDKAVPAPQVAFRRDQPLAALQLRSEVRPLLAADHADLAQAPLQFGRRLDMVGKRLDALGQGRVAVARSRLRPAQRRGRVDRRVEIVAERCAQGLLIALRDVHAVDDRRPEVLRLAIDDLGNGTRFGLQPLHAAVRVRKRRARGLELRSRREMRLFTGARGSFGFRQRLLCDFPRLRQRLQIAEALRRLRKPCEPRPRHWRSPGRASPRDS